MDQQPILNRQQLSQFLPNFEAIKAFENLFKMASQVLPDNQQDLELASGLAQQQAGEALANLAVVANQLSLMLLAPISQNEPQNIDDLKPPVQTQADIDNLAPPVQDAVNVTGNAATATALKTARNIDGQAFDGTQNITVIAPGTAAAASKATPVDADQLPLVDSAASNVLKKLTWANLKATLATWIGGNLIDAYFKVLQSSGNYTQTQAETSVILVATSGRSYAVISGGGGNVSPGVLALRDLTAGANRLDIDSTGLINARNGLTVTGTFTTPGGATFHATNTALSNGAGAAAGTITNAPAAGNPTKWIGINDNGTTRYIPAW